MKKFANVALLVTLVFAPAQAQANMDIGQVELDRVAHSAVFEAEPVMYSVHMTNAIGSVPGK